MNIQKIYLKENKKIDFDYPEKINIMANLEAKTLERNLCIEETDGEDMLEVSIKINTPLFYKKEDILPKLTSIFDLIKEYFY